MLCIHKYTLVPTLILVAIWLLLGYELVMEIGAFWHQDCQVVGVSKKRIEKLNTHKSDLFEFLYMAILVLSSAAPSQGAALF